MGRNKGVEFGFGGIMNRGNALPSGARPGNGQVIGKKQEQREQVVINAETRDGVFGWKEIIFQNKMVREESKKSAVRRIFAHREGTNADGTPKFSSTQLRYNRGRVRAVYQPVLAIGVVILGYNIWPDSGSSTATSETGSSTSISSETSLSGVFADPGTSEVTTTVAAAAQGPITPTTIQATAVAPNIMPADTGAAVAELQTELIKIGCSVGKDGADGRFGPGTKDGLTTFQANTLLVPDGQYGPASQAKLTLALQFGNVACGAGL